MQILSAQWTLTYDATKLSLVEGLNDKMMPFATAGDMYTVESGVIEGSASNLSLFDVAEGDAFVEVVFEVIGTGETTVNLLVEDFVKSERNADGTSDESKELVIVENGDVVNEIYVGTAITEGVTVVPTTVAPTTVAPTTVAPTTGAPTTVAPTTGAPTTVAPTTGAPDQNPTSSTNSPSTSGTANKPDNSGAVQTGNASMALVILLVLVSASGVLYFTRKRVK